MEKLLLGGEIMEWFEIISDKEVLLLLLNS